ncbi:uncharacterized protein MYCGRDRAFT_94802 [Zymoseptoria tritici IPO323]|uniref:Uncharacterized protein n=1 Tax=Zymoseptoria tritici (strain CBS 115943 / IPO323) TaxID=336722 RepID=F9XF75_ZYMTI|nr:uncharacterized protein MYCGRDRAFT_94802 [Zymoseptoria tritici IPO323]EGP85876.1 hypothetical protein MYCGRDRAFT_94802 [Zymoseptoria tritici IPO323]
MVPVTVIMGLDGSISGAVNPIVSTSSINLSPTQALPCPILKLPAELIGSICMYLTPNIRLKVQRMVYGLGGHGHLVTVLNPQDWRAYHNFSMTRWELRAKCLGAIKSARKTRDLVLIMEMERHTNDPTSQLELGKAPFTSKVRSLMTFLNKFNGLEISTVISMSKAVHGAQPAAYTPGDDKLTKRTTVMIDIAKPLRRDRAPHPADLSNIVSIEEEILWDTVKPADAAAFAAVQANMQYVLDFPVQTGVNVEVPYLPTITGKGLHELGLVLAVRAREYAMQQVDVVSGHEELIIKKHKSTIKWLGCIERWRTERAKRKAEEEAARAEQADSEGEEE